MAQEKSSMELLPVDLFHLLSTELAARYEDFHLRRAYEY